MKPLDELPEEELHDLLSEWKVPPAPARLRAAVFPDPPPMWWLRVWRASLRVPFPVACCLIALFGILAFRQPKTPLPKVIVRTERVEVPVVQKEVVTRIIYRGRAARELHLVTELRPRIIRRKNAEN